MSLLAFDETGKLAANKQTDTSTISSVNGTDYAYIIPEWAPFYEAGFAVYHQETGELLTLGVDYILIYRLESADDALVGAIYGGYALLDNTMTGTFVSSMQSLGGDFVTTTTQAIENGFDTLSNLKSYSWSDLVTPPTFPPTYHTHTVSQVDGVTDVVDSINEMSLAVQGQASKNIQMSDITDLDSTYITPLLTALSNIASAFQQTAAPLPPTTYITYLSETTVDVGAIAADTWTDLPMSLTVTKAGSYLHEFYITPILDSGATDVLYRWVYDDSDISKSALNHFQNAIPSGTVVKLQIRIVGASSTQCVIADANRMCMMSLAYVSV